MNIDSFMKLSALEKREYMDSQGKEYLKNFFELNQKETEKVISDVSGYSENNLLYALIPEITSSDDLEKIYNQIKNLPTTATKNSHLSQIALNPNINNKTAEDISKNFGYFADRPLAKSNKNETLLKKIYEKNLVDNPIVIKSLAKNINTPTDILKKLADFVSKSEEYDDYDKKEIRKLAKETLYDKEREMSLNKEGAVENNSLEQIVERNKTEKAFISVTSKYCEIKTSCSNKKSGERPVSLNEMFVQEGCIFTKEFLEAFDKVGGNLPYDIVKNCSEWNNYNKDDCIVLENPNIINLFKTFEGQIFINPENYNIQYFEDEFEYYEFEDCSNDVFSSKIMREPNYTLIKDLYHQRNIEGILYYLADHDKYADLLQESDINLQNETVSIIDDIKQKIENNRNEKEMQNTVSEMIKQATTEIQNQKDIKKQIK